jgi:hypothetical protein
MTDHVDLKYTYFFVKVDTCRYMKSFVFFLVILVAGDRSLFDDCQSCFQVILSFFMSGTQCFGSLTFWYGSGCGTGSSDLYLLPTDPVRIREAQEHTYPTDLEHWYIYFYIFKNVMS